jgi:uncharacterized membrane protein YqjE
MRAGGAGWNDPSTQPDLPDRGADVTASPPPAPSTTQAARAIPLGEPGRHAANGMADEPSLGQLVSDASTHVSTLVRSEIELAKLELRATVKNAGVGAGLFAAAGVVALFSLVYGFQALAEGIAALGVYRWLAFLIVFAFQLVLAGLFVFLGIKKIKRVKAPEKTIKTTRETVDYLKKSRG